MAIEINGKTYRNLQEQVFENVEDIEDLQEAVEDLQDTTYSKTQIDNKDAEVLAEAKAYTYSKPEADEKFATITSVNTELETKVDKFVPTAGAVANIELYDEEEYANLMIGVKGENEATYKNYVSISSDGDVNIKADESFTMGVQNNNGTVLLGKNHDMEFTAQSGYDINFKVGNLGKVCVTETGIGTLVKKEIALKEDIVPIIPNQSASATDTLTKLTIGDTVYSVGSGSTPSNMVTTDTTQDITGAKTFTTNPIKIVNNSKGLKLLSGTNDSANAKLGFTLYNSATENPFKEIGFLEGDSTSNRKTVSLGYYNTKGNSDSNYADYKLGFSYYGYNTSKGDFTAYRLWMPNKYDLKNYDTPRWIPIDFTDGTNTVRADDTGIVNISSLLPTVPVVVANPQGSALISLDSIQIGNTIYSIASGSGGTSREVGIISADAMDIYGGQPISSDKQTILEQYGYSGIDYDNKFYMLDSYTSNTQVYKNGTETITYNTTTKVLTLA